MARTESKMLPLGTKAPNFNLLDTDRKRISLDNFKGSRGLLVMFICNHCPFVKHLREKLSEVCATYMEKGIAVVAINSNDAENYPEDSPANMAIEKKTQNYVFPYLFDDTQAVARAYDAACTPDFFLFDSQQKLVYRGQFDDSRPGNDLPVTGADLSAAMDALLLNKTIPTQQKPSIGCNIKWKVQ